MGLRFGCVSGCCGFGSTVYVSGIRVGVYRVAMFVYVCSDNGTVSSNFVGDVWM